MFTHESGIHVDGILKFSYTYESFLPDEIGASRRIVVGKHSGKHAVWDKLKEMGIEVDKKQNLIYKHAVSTIVPLKPIPYKVEEQKEP